MPNSKKDLIIGSSRHLSIQVETANIQLSIASQLSLNIEQKRFVGVLKNIDKEVAVTFISRNLYLDEALIEKYEDHWNWGELSENKALPWSLALIEQFKDQWVWGGICVIVQ